jgi:hypothetical protein
VASICVLFPDACRRVKLPIGHAFGRAVWPATWPAFVTGFMLAGIRPYLGSGLPGVAVGGVAGGLLYVAFFVFAVGRRDREQYSARLWELVGRKRDLAPAA